MCDVRETSCFALSRSSETDPASSPRSRCDASGTAWPASRLETVDRVVAISVLLLHFEPSARTLNIGSGAAVVAVVVGVDVNDPGAVVVGAATVEIVAVVVPSIF